MDSRSKGILATIASVVLCGCPGLFLCVFGAAITLGAPVNTEFNGVSNSTALPPALGAVLLCVALILLLIPIAVAFFTLRKKPAPAIITNEPLPPAS